MHNKQCLTIHIENFALLMYTMHMSTEKNSMTMALTFFTLVGGLVWTLSAKVYPLLAEGSGASKGEFYTLVGIIFALVLVFIRMTKLETSTNQKTDALAKKVSELETKIIAINDHIDQSAEDSRKINASIEKLLERIEAANKESNKKAEEMNADSNKRIDKVLTLIAENKLN